MNWFVIYAQGHHGYPQPEESYERVVYSSTCPRCGIYEAQVAPFRVKREIGAPHSHFVQLNWVFDTFFARQSVADTLERAGLTGISFSSVIDHRSGETVADIWQLCMSTTISCAEVSRLPTVTCRPDNEESRWELPGPKRYPPDAPYCASVKYHPPTSIALHSAALASAPDLFQTREWFGSGGSAFRLSIASERFVALVREQGWRGLSFKPVHLDGMSQRAA